MPSSAGYSGTPLVRKLGYRPGMRVHLRRVPRDYDALVAPWPDGVRRLSRLAGRFDLIHAFDTERRRLARELPTLDRALRDDGMLWISWPKKASGVPSSITEDVVRELALPLGLVDVKVCAVDATWSALKLVRRRERRAR